MTENILKNKLTNAYHVVLDDVTGEAVMKKNGEEKRTMYLPKKADFGNAAAYICFNGELAFAAETFDKIGTASGRRSFLAHMNKAIVLLCEAADMPPFVWDDEDAKAIYAASASVKTDAYSNGTSIVTNSEAGLKRLIVDDAYHILNREARPRRTVIKNARIAAKAEKRRATAEKAAAKAAEKAAAEDAARAAAIEAGRADPENAA